MKELIQSTGLIRKPSATYFIEKDFLIGRDRKTKKRKKIQPVTTLPGYLYFVQGQNLQEIKVLRTPLYQKKLP